LSRLDVVADKDARRASNNINLFPAKPPGNYRAASLGGSQFSVFILGAL
jgi:hypothetical protein